MKKAFAITMGLLLAVTVVAERKMNIVKIQAGDTFSDVSKTVTQALSDKHAGSNGISISLVFKGEGSVGAYNPKIKDWSKAQKFVMEIFNSAKTFQAFHLIIVPKNLGGKSRYNARSDNKFTLKPGKNKISLDLGDFTNNSGTPFDFSNIVQFYIAPIVKEGATGDISIFIKSMYLTFP